MAFKRCCLQADGIEEALVLGEVEAGLFHAQRMEAVRELLACFQQLVRTDGVETYLVEEA